jgi:hypothetical protein
MNIKNKIAWSLVLATEGVTATGVINGWPTMGVASVILGGTAMAMALLLPYGIILEHLVERSSQCWKKVAECDRIAPRTNLFRRCFLFNYFFQLVTLGG